MKQSADVVFRTLRRTCISRLVLAGLAIRTVQELTGHKTIIMKMCYSHLVLLHKQRAIEVLEDKGASEVTASPKTAGFVKAA